MSEQTVHYAVLRDLDRWDESARWAGLQRQADGALALAQVPGVLNGKPIILPNSVADELSGLAVGNCKDLYIADTLNQCVIKLDSLCNARTVLGGMPNQFKKPRGLLVANGDLYVADSGHSHVQVFRLPSLELRVSWEGVVKEPIALAADSLGRIYILDAHLKSVLRFGPTGVPDAAYNLLLADQLSGYQAVSLALDIDDTLYVADKQSSTILRVDKMVQRLDPIVGDKPAIPGAMTARGKRLYVADRGTGQIWVFDCAAGVFLGALQDYRGPVTALALAQDGTLYIKPGLDDAWHQLSGDAAFVQSGYLTAGPFDAGEGNLWERVHANVDLPEGTQAELKLFTAADSTVAPVVGDFIPALALDTLVRPGRFLWLRLTLQSDDRRRASPLLRQVQAETTAESYMNHLPAVYRRDDAPTGFLEHWLALFRAELGDLELALEEMPGRFDPLIAPEADLRWLASWLAFNPPSDLHGDDLRKLLRRVHELNDRRGTLFGFAEMIELYTGVRPAIFESFRERHIWQLGRSSTLGFDTTLPSALPDGMILPGHTLADPQLMGLRGDYYTGIDFGTQVLSRIDAQVDFDWVLDSPDPKVPNDWFSVRWTGQVSPRYSEKYRFHVLSDDGVRLYVDGVLIINQWIDQGQTLHHSVISLDLEAGRWYSIQLEYYEKTVGATIKLYWSSRSQPREIIPQGRLYAVRDETAQLELTPLEKQAGTILIGQTVVGESGPLEKADFGMPLFSETAHLFTVSVPADALPATAQREMLKRIIEAEKPAHADYHLCFVEARMRVGFQSRLGIDTIVAGPPPPLDLEGATLGLDSYLGDAAGDRPASRVGKGAHLGQDTLIR